MNDKFSQFLSACETGSVDMVASLIELVDPQAECNEAIQYASQNGHIDIVRLLLKDPRVDPSDLKNYAIQLASQNGHIDVVRLLLDDPRVDPSDDNNLAIQYASEYGHIDVIKLLLDDSRVGYDDLNIMRAIQWARYTHQTDTINLLTEHMYRLDGPEYNKNIL